MGRREGRNGGLGKRDGRSGHTPGARRSDIYYFVDHQAKCPDTGAGAIAGSGAGATARGASY